MFRCFVISLVIGVGFLSEEVAGDCGENCICESNTDYFTPNDDIDLISNVHDEEGC
eukprot:TRINITY_DN5875_c0_g1_i1.p2 TRINITY_DN5875_c0_g1~~TRINITY_DN5875_c0_g1_i1.p2  ORF type:complete len:56 (-),score=10.51 TRINITY_DN5875_c0_g1_i1:10-177(-)